MNFKRALFTLLCLNLCLGASAPAYGQTLVYENELFSRQSDTALIIDYNDDALGEDLSLQFGSTLGQSLLWDSLNSTFKLSSNLEVDGEISQTGSTLTLDSDEAGNPDQDIDIVANQGSEAPGVLRYSDSQNAWQLSNDGVVFQNILSGSAGGGGGVFSRDIGFFNIPASTTGTISVNGVGFSPNFVSFTINNDIEAENWDSKPNQSELQQGSFGWGQDMLITTELL